jgi:hypothetical protein
MPSIFISHNHNDKPFVRRLAGDMSRMGIKVWVDEAEINVGDSLIAKISAALGEMEYLGVVLSPNSVSSSWVQEELQQALYSQISDRTVKVLPILLRDCLLPVFLRDKLYADFRDEVQYASALFLLVKSMGIPMSKVTDYIFRDAVGEFIGTFEMSLRRPTVWHCIYCGWRCDEYANNFNCASCKSIRPFVSGDATLKKCHLCEGLSPDISFFCEWCGKGF